MEQQTRDKRYPVILFVLKYFTPSSTCTKPISRHNFPISHSHIPRKGTCLWKRGYWWTQYESARKRRTTCWWNPAKKWRFLLGVSSVNVTKWAFGDLGIFLLWIWSHLLKKSLIENYNFCAVKKDHVRSKNRDLFFLNFRKLSWAAI